MSESSEKEVPSWSARSDSVHPVDRIGLYLLVGLIVGYQFQAIAPWIATFRIRELLLCYLYLRLFVFYRDWFTPILAAVFVFFLVAALVGVQTFLRYGGEMAVNGTLRFLFVPLLAPLVAVFGRGAMKNVLYVWIGFVIVGAASAVYQALGGEMQWLVQDYLSVRGGMVRFRTILGEPNRGGMASAILLLAVVTVLKGAGLRMLALLSALVLLALSLSKAAMLGWAIVVIFLAVASRSATFSLRVRSQAWRGLTATLVVACAAVVLTFSVDSRFTVLARQYLSQALPSLTGQTESMAVGDDIRDRLFERTEVGLRMATTQTDAYFLDVFVGSSFGVAGSAGFELRGPSRAILPHNSVLELYLVGGVVLLASFAIIVVSTTRRLIQVQQQKSDLFFLGTLTVIVCFGFSYPVIYEPVLGTPLWIVIGAAAQTRYRGFEPAVSPVPRNA